MDSRRWTYEECKHLLPVSKFRNREVHSPITKWEELQESEKEMLLEVKEIITSFIGECTILLFGSRIKGRWHDESDWDIFVITDINDKELYSKLKTYSYKSKIDMQFVNKSKMGRIREYTIEIP